MGESLIIVNKTQIYGTGENGDIEVLFNIQDNILNTNGNAFNYTEWRYPNTYQKDTYSMTGAIHDPEVIEICQEVMYEKCPSSLSNGCGFIVGVVGKGADQYPVLEPTGHTPEDRLSSFRIKGFYGHNKLKVDMPVITSPESYEINGAFYDYFWFSINDTTYHHDVDFDY
jgi:hypothetical protein